LILVVAHGRQSGRSRFNMMVQERPRELGSFL
jgi:hypothetical protein